MKTPITRRVFFWTLTVSYFVTTTVVLFFVFGYRHDSKHDIFVYTGSLTLKTNPKSVVIKKDGNEPSSRLVNIINDSYFITGLRPGNHQIDVVKDAFKPWSKEVNIHSGLATEFWNILLVRENYDREFFDINNIDDFFPAPKENVFATTSQLGKTLVVNVFDIEKNQSIDSVILPKTEFSKGNNENIEWSPDSKSFIIPTMEDYIIEDIETNEYISILDIVEQENIKLVRWDPEEKDSIYFVADETLFKTAISEDEEESITSNIQEDVLSYDFADDGFYWLTTEGDVMYSADKQNLAKADALTEFDIDISHDNYRLIAYDKHRVVAINDNESTLHVYNDADDGIYTQKISKNIKGVHFSDDGKKMLYYSPFEIFVYFTRESQAQPVRTENQTQSIVRFSQEIDNVHFAKDYEHVIFTIGDAIKVTELDHRGSRITETIAELGVENTKLISKHKMNKLLFIDSSNGKRQLQAIEFPEKETLF